MKRAFTLIELLIVIAIIAILALIAIPNFLEAQVRAKVSRVMADHRSIAMAIEAYTTDYNREPIGDKETQLYFSDLPKKVWWVAAQLTTPVAYMTSVPSDPFLEMGGAAGTPQGSGPRPHLYDSFVVSSGESWSSQYSQIRAKGVYWALRSLGPSRLQGVPGYAAAGLGGAILGTPDNWPGVPRYPSLFYDPTNGTMSFGWMVRSSRGVEPVHTGK